MDQFFPLDSVDSVIYDDDENSETDLFRNETHEIVNLFAPIEPLEQNIDIATDALINDDIETTKPSTQEIEDEILDMEQEFAPPLCNINVNNVSILGEFVFLSLNSIESPVSESSRTSLTVESF